MNVIGIVCEYNPFHKGHKYQIDEIKKEFKDSVIVVVTSTLYTQRGELSLLTKEEKTKIALENNVDIVIELPFVFSNQSADTFASASIRLLNELKIDTLVFGSESNDLEKLTKVASIQINNKEFDLLVKEYMDKGNNYPSSLSKAVKDLTRIEITESNDLLAISYIKEILSNKYSINIHPIKRTNNYKGNKETDIISAFDIRQKLLNNEDVNKYIPYNKNRLNTLDYNLFFNLIKYSILEKKDEINKIHLVDEGLENKIYKAALSSNNLNELIDSIKSKRYTYNKINRILINIFTNFTKEDAKKYKKLEYIRILGMTTIGKKYINSIKKETTLPIITKFENYPLLNKELEVTNLYNLISKTKIDEINYHVIIKELD